MDGKTFVEIAGWVILAALVVLVVMNAPKFAIVIGAASSAVASETMLLTGSGYGNINYGVGKAA